MDVAELHAQAKERYWKSRDLPSARRLLEEGIALARLHGLKGEEKALNYDLAAFCWHGWDEPGIVVSPDDSAAGGRAAEENLRLAQELGRPAVPMGNAWWMVGAYRMQSGDFEGAKAAFETFRTFAEDDPVRLLLAEGYVRIPRRFLETTFDLGPICAGLRAAGGDGPLYADQLETALEVMTRRWATENRRRSAPRIEAVDPVEEAEALGEALHACVHAGASVHFVLPFSREEAAGYWREASGRIVLAVREGDRIAGTVSLIVAMPPNQRHRGEVSKMLVHPDFRRRGLARALLAALEAVAREEGKTLLTLDTVTGGEAEGLYRSVGYEFAGSIPDFASSTDGRSMESTSLYYKRL